MSTENKARGSSAAAPGNLAAAATRSPSLPLVARLEAALRVEDPYANRVTTLESPCFAADWPRHRAAQHAQVAA